MVNYRGKKQATRPQVVDKYADERYAAARLELADALAESKRLERDLEEEKARPRIGCKRCNYTALADMVDPYTGEVTRAICPDCAPVIDNFIEQYTGVRW
jgi:hypothetical protein